jgi:hypothetical protein
MSEVFTPTKNVSCFRVLRLTACPDFTDQRTPAHTRVAGRNSAGTITSVSICGCTKTTYPQQIPSKPRYPLAFAKLALIFFHSFHKTFFCLYVHDPSRFSFLRTYIVDFLSHHGHGHALTLIFLLLSDSFRRHLWTPAHVFCKASGVSASRTLSSPPSLPLSSPRSLTSPHFTPFLIPFLVVHKPRFKVSITYGTLLHILIFAVTQSFLSILFPRCYHLVPLSPRTLFSPCIPKLSTYRYIHMCL